MSSDSVPVQAEETKPPSDLGEFLFYFLRLGALGFGGPIALASYMQRELVEERKWVAKQDYLEGLAFSQLSPGPLAAQLAMYLGWVRRTDRSHSCRRSVYPAILLDGGCAGHILRTLWTTQLDSRNLLRNRGRSQRDYRAKCMEAAARDARQGLAALGSVRRARHYDCLDRIRDCNASQPSHP